MNTTLQPVKTSDIDQLLILMREYYACDNLRFDEPVARRGLETLIGDSSLGRTYRILLDGAVAGYTFCTYGFSLEFAGRFALVDEIYIREEFRGRGAGAQALKQIEKECRAIGIRAIRLEVEHANTGARRLYERLGFEAHERYLMTKWVVDGSP